MVAISEYSRGLEQDGRLVHLYRGAPPVRLRSKYKSTVRAWTLCGINRKLGSKGHRQPAQCTEEAGGVSFCLHCLSLMRPTACTQRNTPSAVTVPQVLSELHRLEVASRPPAVTLNPKAAAIAEALRAEMVRSGTPAPEK
jgi:hypothetical protein